MIPTDFTRCVEFQPGFAPLDGERDLLVDLPRTGASVDSAVTSAISRADNLLLRLDGDAALVLYGDDVFLALDGEVALVLDGDTAVALLDIDVARG